MAPLHEGHPVLGTADELIIYVERTEATADLDRGELLVLTSRPAADHGLSDEAVAEPARGIDYRACCD